MNNERDDALTSVHCPQCHAVTAVPTSPIPPLTRSNESELDRLRSKGPQPGDKNGMFNACPECGMLWAGVAGSLKDVARDEPTGERARRATWKAIAWALLIGGLAVMFLGTTWAIAAGVIVIVAGIAALSYSNKQERGSKRASGIAAD